MRKASPLLFGLNEDRMSALVVEAIDTLWRLQRTQPGDYPRGLHCSMPRPVRDIRVAYGWQRARPSVDPPTAAAIDRLDIVLRSIAGALGPEDRLLVWMRAYGVPWKRVERQYGRSRAALWRQWVIALWRVVSFAHAKGYARALSLQKTAQHSDRKGPISVARSAGLATVAALAGTGA
jgi:hypothetical protein